MFERYTERARRVIFFARYESSQFGSTIIDTEHLLLGLIREDQNLPARFLNNPSAVHEISDEVTARLTVRKKLSTAIDLPLSEGCKNILHYACEEAERLDHRHIGTEHLLLGMLREEKCVAAEVLRKHGMELSAIREKMAKAAPEKEQPRRSQAHVMGTDDGKRALVTHLLMTIMYRLVKVLNGAPDGFESFRAGVPGTTPHDVINRMIQVCHDARTLIRGSEFPVRVPTADFASDVKALYQALEDLRVDVEKWNSFEKAAAEKLLKPLADLLTCIGQLTTVRLLAGSPVEPDDGGKI